MAGCRASGTVTHLPSALLWQLPCCHRRTTANGNRWLSQPSLSGACVEGVGVLSPKGARYSSPRATPGKAGTPGGGKHGALWAGAGARGGLGRGRKGDGMLTLCERKHGTLCSERVRSPPGGIGRRKRPDPALKIGSDARGESGVLWGMGILASRGACGVETAAGAARPGVFEPRPWASGAERNPILR